MLPVFENFTVYALLCDFFWASVLLFIAQLLRAKIKIFQDLLLPSSVIAGLMGLFLGNQFLDVIPFSGQLGSYSGMFIILIFAGMLLGYTEKKGNFGKTLWNCRDMFLNNVAWEYGQFGIAIIAGLLLGGKVFPNVNEIIGMTMPAGFAGGYGYGGAIGGTLETYGLQDGRALGLTFATIGMFVAIIFGMININIANRKGYLQYTKKLASIPKDEKTGFVEEKNWSVMGSNTMNSGAIDSLSWHILLVFIAAGLGYLSTFIVNKLVSFYIPELCFAVLWGLGLQKVLNGIGYGKHVDKRVVNRLSAVFTDFMVFFGCCSISKSLVTNNWGIILTLSVLGIGINMLYFWVICPRTFGTAWFEQGIILFGMLSGVTASGMTLLRVCDPEAKSPTLEAFAVDMIPICTIDLVVTGVLPVFVGTGHGWLVGGGLILVSMVGLILLKATGCWHKSAKVDVQGK